MVLNHMLMIKGEKRFLLLIVFIAFILRFYKLDSHLPLYSDEASLGYNAYSILKTGRDEYGIFLPFSLRSFGDYKPPLSSYLMIPFIAVFGLNEMSVRLPSAILGTLTVLLIYFLTKQLFAKSDLSFEIFHLKFDLPKLAGLLLAFSPWHLHQSRLAMLVSIELFFLLLGIYFFYQGEKKPIFYALSFLAFSLAVYSYYGSRLTVPLLITGLVFTHKNSALKNKKWILTGVFLMIISLLPLFSVYLKNPLVLTGRVKNINLFNSKDVFIRHWLAINTDGHGQNPAVTRFFHNRPLFYLAEIARGYLKHFSGEFLFLKGDTAEPFQVPKMGVFYLFEALFIPMGLISLIKNRITCRFLFYWLFISPLPSALSAFPPASNRAFGLVIPLTIVSAIGLLGFFNFLKVREHHKIFIIFTCLFLIFNFLFYLRQYYRILPLELARNYLYGNKEIVTFVDTAQDSYDKIIVSHLGGSYAYFLFYKKYPSQKFWQERRLSPKTDELGFEHVDGFGKYEFRRSLNWQTEEKRQRILYVLREEDLIKNPTVIGFNVKKVIYYPNGTRAFQIIDL